MKIKYTVILILICFFCFSGLYAQAVKPEAAIVLKNAVKDAAANKKSVLLTFYAPWSPWSAQLEKVMNDKDCQAILQKYYELPSVIIKSQNLSRIKNYENPGADVLYKQFIGSAADSVGYKPSYPKMVLLDANGKELYQYGGFPDMYQGIKDFSEMLKKTSAISNEEVNNIRDKFNSIYKSVAPPSTDELLKTACKKAASENKKVFLVFTASWCHWCHALIKAMEDPVCKKFFDDNFVIVPVVTKESDKRILEENYGSDALLKKYQENRQGIPFWIIFDKDGKWITDYLGYPAPTDKEYDKFESILKTTTQVSEQDLANIKQAFTTMAK